MRAFQVSLYYINFKASVSCSKLSQCFASLSVVYVKVVEGCVFRERRRLQQSSEFSVRMPGNIIFMFFQVSDKKNASSNAYIEYLTNEKFAQWRRPCTLLEAPWNVSIMLEFACVSKLSFYVQNLTWYVPWLGTYRSWQVRLVPYLQAEFALTFGASKWYFNYDFDWSW